MVPADRPAIDHTLLSPSGRVSKRARKAAMARETARLFADVDFTAAYLKPATADQQRAILLRSAANLRELAARGMKPRKHIKEAERLEKEANQTGERQ